MPKSFNFLSEKAATQNIGSRSSRDNNHRAKKEFSIISIIPISIDTSDNKLRLNHNCVSMGDLILSPDHMTFDPSICVSDLLGIDNRLLGFGDQFAAIESRIGRQSKLMVFEKRNVMGKHNLEWIFYTSIGPFEGDTRGSARIVHLERDWLDGFSQSSVSGIMCFVEKSGSEKANAKYVTAISWNKEERGDQGKS